MLWYNLLMTRVKKTSDAQAKASAKYDKAHTKGVYLKLNTETDRDVIDKLDSVDNRQGYIKSLIRKDINTDKE